MSELSDRLTAALADRYRIERELGQGGMATVYLAEDLKHKRKVALKVLKPELAAVLGAERFVQEITTTASLQHPHILPLFDSGTADGFLFYVMPFIDGETLRDKLNRESQLGVDEAVKITTEVADALHYAHQHGVIHRDIKPENILLANGRPMVADFGIALAVSAAAGGRMTETGLSLGTPHYMSPEQATAEKEITARSDVYSLASVLYEMLAGEPPHAGGSAQAVLMKIITEDAPPVTALRKSVPANVAAALAKALEKVPADRFESTAKFSEALGNAVFRGAATSLRPVAHPLVMDRRSLALSAALVVALGVAAWSTLRPLPAPKVSRYEIVLPPEAPLGGFFGRVAISPDGSRLVFMSNSRGAAIELWIRERDKLEVTRIPGTVGATVPFFSPDGSSVGFYAPGNQLRTVSLSGGTALAITDTALGGNGFAWSSDGYIYGARAGGLGGLLRVRPASGSPVEPFTRLDSTANEIAHDWPEALPNGKGVLFIIKRPTSNAGWDVAVADTRTGAHHILVKGVYARFAASGQLLYVTSGGVLMAVPFNQRTLELTGTPITVVSGVTLRTINVPDLAISSEGTLVYTTGGGGGIAGGEPVWVTREGRESVVAQGWTSVATFVALSPDGSKLVSSVYADGVRQDLWVRDLVQGTVAKLTFDGSTNYRPSWFPDGKRVLFASDREGGNALFTSRANGTGETTLLRTAASGVHEGLVSADGGWLVYRHGGGASGNLFARRLSGDTSEVPLAVTSAQETEPALSPDSRWLAYTSDESGRPEVHVRPFPNAASGRWVVSVDGGSDPLWSRNGRELFYRNSENELVAVEVRSGDASPLGRQRVMFSVNAYSSYLLHQQYDVGPDGRFVMLRAVSAGGVNDLKIIVVQNFFEELRAKVKQ